MPFNGSGTFTRNNGTNSGATTWAQDAAAGTKILSSRHDTHDEDIATGLSTAICKDGQSTPTANLPMGGFKLTGMGTGSASTDSVTLGQVQAAATHWGGTAGGTADALTISLTPSITAYAAGQRFVFIVASTNTGSATININSVGANTIKKDLATAGALANLAAGDLSVNQIAEIVYNGSNFVLVNPHLRTMAFQLASAVAITGGTVTGITDLAVADGGTGASDAAGARTSLGLGTMATQAASAVAITGGTIAGLTSLACASPPDYTVTYDSITRSADISAATGGTESQRLNKLTNVVGTLIGDLTTMGLLS